VFACVVPFLFSVYFIANVVVLNLLCIWNVHALKMKVLHKLNV